MSKMISIGAALVAGAVVASGSALAMPAGCSTVITGPTGMTVGSLSSSTCVLIGDSLYKNFTNGSAGLNKLPTGLAVSFDMQTYAGLDYYALSLSNNGATFALGSTYKWSYEVEVYPSSNKSRIVGVGEDFSQSALPPATSTLTKHITVAGTSDVRDLTETKVGAGSSGGVETFYGPGVTDLLFNETLAAGGFVTSVVNTLMVFNPSHNIVPEPITLLLLGGGLAGLGGLRLRRKK